MSPPYTRLALVTQTACARLVDMLLTSEAGELGAGATLVSKRIRGHRYWYVQRILDGKKTQRYLGRETDELSAVVERWRRSRAEAATRAELVAIARAGGANFVTAAEAKILAQLRPAFSIGAVLVGSHAFAVLGNILGARWQEASVRTEDIDLAHDPAITIAVPADPVVSLTTDLEASPRFDILDPTSPATSFSVRGTEVTVDLLTPMVGKESRTPVPIPALGAAAQPLRFLDYLIEETQPGAVVGGEGALVNVPRPGRFALHKLIVAARRSGASGKAAKDRIQAGALLQLLLEEAPGEVTAAWKEVERRGRAWTDAVRASVARLDPDLVIRLAALEIKALAR